MTEFFPILLKRNNYEKFFKNFCDSAVRNEIKDILTDILDGNKYYFAVNWDFQNDYNVIENFDRVFDFSRKGEIFNYFVNAM